MRETKRKNFKNIASVILARGELDARKLLKAGREVRKKEKWADIVPTGIKIGLSRVKKR